MPTGWIGGPLPLPLASASTPEVVTVDKWYTALSTPLYSKSGLKASNQQFIAFVKAAPFPEDVLESKWHQPWSEPVRRKLLREALFTAYSPFIASETVTLDKWYVELSTPPKRKAAVAQQQFIAFVKAAPFPEDVLESKWHQPWSDPVRRKLLREAPFTAHTPFFETITLDKWYAALSTPLNRKKVVAQQQFLAWSGFTPTETITLDKWYAALSTPPNRKKAVAYQQFIAFVKAAPFPEDVLESKWHQPWSEPVRKKPGLSAGQQLFYAAPAYVPAVVVVDVIMPNMGATSMRRFVRTNAY